MQLFEVLKTFLVPGNFLTGMLYVIGYFLLTMCVCTGTVFSGINRSISELEPPETLVLVTQ